MEQPLESITRHDISRSSPKCKGLGTFGSWFISCYVHWVLQSVRISCEDIKEMHKFKPEIQAGKIVAQSVPLQLLQMWQIFLKYFPQTSRKHIMAAEGDDAAISSNEKFNGFPSGLINLCLWECDSIYKCTWLQSYIRTRLNNPNFQLSKYHTKYHIF